MIFEWKSYMNYYNTKFFFVIVFLVLSTISIFLLDFFKQRELDNFLILKTDTAQHRYDGMVMFPYDTSNIIFNTLVNTKGVVDIFKNANNPNKELQDQTRKELYAYLEDRYEGLKRYNIQQLHFHLPTNESFLRFHRPSKYGDNLTGIRSTVEYVNKNRVAVNGFEEGKIFNGYRFVYPLFDAEKNYIGSVEISHSTKALTDMYERFFSNIDLNIVLLKKVVDEKLFSEEAYNYESYILNENFLYQKSIEISNHIKEIRTNIVNLSEIQEKMDMFENFSVEVRHKRHYDVVSFIGIKNSVTSRNVAYAISFQKSEWLAYYHQEYINQRIFNILFSLLLTIGIFLSLKYYRKVEEEAYHDSLMKIYNRRFFQGYIQQKCKARARKKGPLSLIMFDVDHFKSINDEFGHKIGDEALVFLAQIVNENIRQSDVFARWGGEEFMLLVEDGLPGAVKLSESLRKKIDQGSKSQEKIPHFTCSFGVVDLSMFENLEKSYRIADERLYSAKERGRNRVVSI